MSHQPSRRATLQGLLPSHQDLFHQAESELKIRHYSPKTRKSYLCHIRHFLYWLQGATVPKEAQILKRYLLFLVEQKNISNATLHNCHSALRFLYKETLHYDPVIDLIKRPRSERRLPVVLSQGEVKKLLDSVINLKHRMILALVYAGGLRVGEVVRLKASDIDSQRMLIRVLQGKGGRDRYTLLSQSILEELRTYWVRYRPQKWLFPGAREGRHLTERSAQQVFHRAVQAAGIQKPATMHTLRHYADPGIMPTRLVA